MEMGLLDQEGCERAQAATEELDQPLGEILVKLELVTEQDLAKVLSKVFNLPEAESDEYPDHPLFNGTLSGNFLKSSRVMPLSDEEDHVVVAMADPSDSFTVEALEHALGKSVRVKIGLPRDIERAFERAYEENEGSLSSILKDIADDFGDVSDDDIKKLKDMASEAPVIRLVNRIIGTALEERASDIHIEPYENQLIIRYRVDGVLREVDSPPVELTPAIISRIKIMANLNIAERRLTQDGRVSLQIQGKPIDLRVSILPSLYGESAVIRILEDSAVRLEFESLGMGKALHDRFMNVLNQRHGILLVTGPTGSGKTTTLYTALKLLNKTERKIITVEDPIEYQLNGITQVQVNANIGLSFSNVLRSIVRQDPDVIMIGEMRDLETAEIAVQSSLTGHVVLSTLHTNDAAGAITRLLDMGVEDYLLTSTVNGVVGQRLVRTLCAECREEYSPPMAFIKRMGLDKHIEDCQNIRLYRPVGCKACGGQGYVGRLGIYEILVVDENIRQLILQKASTVDIQAAALETGMLTMFEDGIDKSLRGLTTIEEVRRITREY